MTHTHSYSTVLFDVTWEDIGNSLDAVDSLDSPNEVDIRASFDTSGGELEDGTTFETQAVLNTSYEYELGNGATSLDEFAEALSQVPLLGDKATIKESITSA